jgi:hypothetical protein
VIAAAIAQKLRQTGGAKSVLRSASACMSVPA